MKIEEILIHLLEEIFALVVGSIIIRQLVVDMELCCNDCQRIRGEMKNNLRMELDFTTSRKVEKNYYHECRTVELLISSRIGRR